MLIVTGTIKLESADALAQLMSKLAGRAKRSRKDEGCLAYTFSVNIEDPSEIILTEKWESEALLNAHLAIPDEEFSAAIGAAKIESAVVVSNEVTAEKELLKR